MARPGGAPHNRFEHHPRHKPTHPAVKIRSGRQRAVVNRSVRTHDGRRSAAQVKPRGEAGFTHPPVVAEGVNRAVMRAVIIRTVPTSRRRCWPSCSPGCGGGQGVPSRFMGVWSGFSAAARCGSVGQPGRRRWWARPTGAVAYRELCTRTVVPALPDRTCTRSHSSLASRTARSREWLGPAAEPRPIIGSVIMPGSET